jgi:hypothetical protein
MSSSNQEQVHERLSALGQYTQQLTLNDWTDTQTVRYIRHFPQMSDIGFEQIILNCPQLTYLKFVCIRLSQRSFTTIGQHCHHLKHLDWTPSYSTDIDWLASLVSDHAVCRLSDLEIICQDPPSNRTLSILQKFNHLTRFNIVNSGFSGLAARTLLLPPPTAPATLWCPHLTTLGLYPCFGLSDTTLIGFITTHPHLEQLELDQAGKVTDASLDAIREWLPRLKRLKLTHNSQVSLGGVQQLINGACPALVSLDLHWCRNISKPDLLGPLYTHSTMIVILP